MAAARISPTANLLRKSRLFALPQALAPVEDPATSRTVRESNSATRPYPTRASIVSPASSLARGDWGLKRALPSKSTTDKSSRPVVRLHELDTYEHVTDFESAADHTVTLEKFQELHLPMSLPSKVNYSSGLKPGHQSPFEDHLDNTDTSKNLEESGAKQFRHSGPWLAAQTEAEFDAYLKKVGKSRPELLQKLRQRFAANRTAERRKEAQDNGEDLEALGPVEVTDQEFLTYLKSLRADPFRLGPVIFELLDLPSPPPVPNERMGQKYYQSPGTKLCSTQYAVTGTPMTHPSAGLSYTRSHALIYNHPTHGPQTYQRPVESRILRPKGKFNKSKRSKAMAGVGGIVVEDVNATAIADRGQLPGLAAFDASIPGGAKYWVNPIRASISSEGRINLASYPASSNSKAPYGLVDYTRPGSISISDVTRGHQRSVPKLDRFRRVSRAPEGERQSSEDITKNLMKTLRSAA